MLHTEGALAAFQLLAWAQGADKNESDYQLTTSKSEQKYPRAER
jgi:hypothetical protein